MLNKQWHSLVIGLIDLTGSLLLIGSIMLEPAFWRNIDGFVIGLIIMAIVPLFLFFPIAQSIFGIVCFRVLQKPHRKMMIAYTVMQNISGVITTIAWLIAISIFYKMNYDFSDLATLIISIFFSCPVNIVKGIVAIVFGVKYCRNASKVSREPRNSNCA